MALLQRYPNVTFRLAYFHCTLRSDLVVGYELQLAVVVALRSLLLGGTLSMPRLICVFPYLGLSSVGTDVHAHQRNGRTFKVPLISSSVVFFVVVHSKESPVNVLLRLALFLRFSLRNLRHWYHFINPRAHAHHLFEYLEPLNPSVLCSWLVALLQVKTEVYPRMNPNVQIGHH